MLKYIPFLIIAALSPFSQAVAKDVGNQKTRLEHLEGNGIAYNSGPFPKTCGELASWSKIASYRLASYLTDPVCKMREYSVRLQILDEIPPSPCIMNLVDSICSYVEAMQYTDKKWLDRDLVARFSETCFFVGGMIGYSAAAQLTTLPAIALRFAASNLESENFIHYRGLMPEKQLEEDNSFSHMQWNVCGVKAGYDIEEGGQMPIRDELVPFSENRIVKIAQKILEEDADIVCLNEVFDMNDAVYLVEALQNYYAHFVIQCGSRTHGLNSGLFFASKFAIKDISFTPFPKEFLVGLAKYTEKGFLSVNAYDERGSIATIIATHLQHSIEPNYPSKEEQLARYEELNLIKKAIDALPEENIVVSGDLNLDDAEFMQFNPKFYSQFTKAVEYDSFFDEESKTWLGDQWYVEHGNKNSTFSPISGHENTLRKPSTGINLDHVLVKIKPAGLLIPQIYTIVKSTGYKPDKISRESLSDHMILLSEIVIAR
jgi:endonuclease/exonuclease/phosphatase family metal-dependent hydrolase